MANLITYSRMVLAIPVLWLMYIGAYNSALVLFIVAALTDWLDGFVARKTGTVSEVGKVMDQIADKVLINTVMVVALDLKWIPSWLVIVIIWRDILVSAVRILAAKKGNVLAANIFGKLKTVFQMAFVIILLSRKIFFSQILNISMIWTVFALTTLSALVYIVQNRSVFETQEGGGTS